MHIQYLKTRLPEILTRLNSAELTKGQVYDLTLELVDFITTALMKNPKMRTEYLVQIYGLEEDVEEGLPDDSRKILSYYFANNIVRVMFDAQEERDAERQARIAELVEECVEEGNVSKIH